MNINTGDITLTDATETSVLYIKNHETCDFVITALIYNLGNSTGAASSAVNCKFDILRNPVTGAIITNATPVLVPTSSVASNQNFGSANTYTIDCYKGATAEVPIVSTGLITISTLSASNTGRTVVGLGAITLPKGSSLAINYTPPTGNSSQIVQFAIAGYVRTTAVAEPH